MRKLASVLVIIIGVSLAEVISFDNNWAKNPLFNLVSETPNGVQVIFSSHKMAIENMMIDGMPMQAFGVPGIFLPVEEGAPNLAGTGRYIALPQGAQAQVSIIGSRTEIYHNIDIAPAPNIPRDDDDSPLRYVKNMAIYGRNALYPESPVVLSSPMKIRGVDVVILHITPFQYNPVTKDLIVYKDLRVKVDFVGGNGNFGEDRLRSRFWEPILQGNLLNYQSLPKIDFYAPERMKSRIGYEYIIIVPNDPVFEAWGDTIKAWRKLQGISCEVFTLTEVGGSDSAAIKNFLQNAYNTWSPAPVAFLILSDYPVSGRTYGITSPRRYSTWAAEYYVSDMWYADFDNNYIPELHHGRICAQTQSQLSIMINKFLSYERNPYTAANFYNEPLVAVAWQTERWFQLCGEVIRGFLINSLGKSPARQYAIYLGSPTPGCAWSTYGWTSSAVSYWNSLGYVELTNPNDATWWSNGSASGITNAINSGAFLVQHRDHGYTGGWGEPAYNTSNLNSLTNDMYTFVNSTNCQTGQYNYASEVFVEKFHRIEHGAAGANAPSEVSYSFVNDAYIWGFYDGLWSQFDPGYPTFDLTGSDNLRPCMAMTNGKLYLMAAGWGLSSGGKQITSGLFHHFGDAFMTLGTEVPESLTVAHAPSLLATQTSFSVSADSGSVIALTVHGEIIGTALGTGAPVAVAIPSQTPGDTVKITITKANYFRYVSDVPIIADNYAYVILGSTVIDSSGNGQANPGENVSYGVWAKNIGSVVGQGIYGLLSTVDPFVSMTVDSSWFGNIHTYDSLHSDPDYGFDVANNCPDNHTIQFTLEFHDAYDSIWISHPEIVVYAPIITYQSNAVVGGNGILDPGETADLVVSLKNEGSANAENVTSTLLTSSSNIIINDATGGFGTIPPDSTIFNLADPYNITADISTPYGTPADFSVIVQTGVYLDTLDFSMIIGQSVPSDTGYYYAYYPGGPYEQAPVYAWFAIDTTQTTHPGTSLNLDINQTVVVNLPFTFKYYGVNYSRISISSNGWIAMDSTGSTDYSNTGIPNADGPPSMIAGIWDYLDPGNVGAPSDIYYYYDAPNHRFVVEYFRVEHNPSGNQETFEIILCDPAYYPTPTGDGEILVQYPSGILVPQSSTVGIENQTQLIGIQYLFNNNYDSLAVPITSSFVIKYTTHYPTPPGAVEELSLQNGIPLQTMLNVLYPNPFSSRIDIRYQIADNRQEISLKVYDASGRLVRVLNEGSYDPGYYTAIWNGCDNAGRKVPAGIYFVYLQAADYNKIEKAVFLR